MTDRLSIYNGAVTVHFGEEPLATLTDDRPIRHALDKVWDRDGIDTCLQKGLWNHAIRTVRLDYDTTVTPEFGYQYAFQKPSDYVRLASLCTDEYFDNPIRRYDVSAGYFWTDLQQIYMRYVSNGLLYGLNYAEWPPNFARMVEAWFATQVAKTKAYAEYKDAVEEDYKALKNDAMGTDAQEQPARQNPRGSWSRARGGGRTGDFGTRSRLIG